MVRFLRYFLKLIFGNCRVEIFDLGLCFEVEELKSYKLRFQNKSLEITRECEATSFQAEHKWEKVVKSNTQDQNGLLKKFHQTYFFNSLLLASRKVKTKTSSRFKFSKQKQNKSPREGQLGTL